MPAFRRRSTRSRWGWVAWALSLHLAALTTAPGCRPRVFRARPTMIVGATPRASPKLVEVVADRVHIGERVQFARDSAGIRPEAQEALDRVAQQILGTPEIKRVVVEGHTDELGGYDYNLQLSRRRAAAVIDYLVRRGVPRSMLEARAYGKTRPLLPNYDAAGRAANRRVEFMVAEQDVERRTLEFVDGQPPRMVGEDVVTWTVEPKAEPEPGMVEPDHWKKDWPLADD